MSKKNRKQPAPQNNTWKRRLWMFGAPAAVVGVCVLLKSISPTTASNAAGPVDPRQANAPARNAAPQQLPQAGPQGADLSQVGRSANAANPSAAIVANVNGEEIPRSQLASMCLERFGKGVVESMINQRLIQQHCAEAKIQVTSDDVNREIDRLARKFGMTYDDYLKMLKQERGISPDQYGNEIIWPTLALRRLAAQQIKPSEQEIDQAFQSQYGEAVKVRIIVCDNMQDAQSVHAKVTKDPALFAALAKSVSRDPSASVNGLIQPIRRFVGDKALENAAFALRENQISPIVTMNVPGMKAGEKGAQQFIVLKCEGRLEPVNVNFEAVKSHLADTIMDRKLRDEAAKIYKHLEQNAKIQNVYNDATLRQQHPTVAALVNGRPITDAELAEECVMRHGENVLESLINRRLLERELKVRSLSVTQDDIDGEVAKAALAMGKRDQNNAPDINAWLTMVTKESGMSVKVYIEDSVWPSVALKKLSGAAQVTEEDLQKSFEANYGKRVRCRAIVLGNMRDAQKVWTLARDAKSPQEFGKIAEQFSTDPSSKALQGQIPLIQRYGGQTMVEEEAFKLQPGEISGIVTMRDSFVILYCEGFKEAQNVSFADVKDLIHDDIRDKKERIEMGKAYAKLKESATVNNFLAGTIHTPNKQASKNSPIDTYGGTVPQNAAAPQRQPVR